MENCSKFVKDSLCTSYPHGRPSLDRETLLIMLRTPEKAQEEGRTTWSKADDMRMRKKLRSLFKKATPAVCTKLWPHQALCYQWGCNTHRHAHTPRHITFLFVSAGGKLSTDISTQEGQRKGLTHLLMKNRNTCVTIKYSSKTGNEKM